MVSKLHNKTHAQNDFRKTTLLFTLFNLNFSWRTGQVLTYRLRRAREWLSMLDQTSYQRKFQRRRSSFSSKRLLSRKPERKPKVKYSCICVVIVIVIITFTSSALEGVPRRQIKPIRVFSIVFAVNELGSGFIIAWPNLKQKKAV